MSDLALFSQGGNTLPAHLRNLELDATTKALMGGGADTVFYENTRTVTTNYTLSSSNNAHSVGPITINSGIVVTIPSGARWVVL